MSAETSNEPARHEPLRILGVFDASMLVIGSVVGAGIFLVGGFVAESVTSPAAFLGVWLLGGIFALCGALCNGELGVLFPRGGGEYIYLSEAFGSGLGFLSGWTSFWIGFPGSIATLASGFGRNVCALLGLDRGYETFVGIGVVVLLTGLNVLGLKRGKGVQNVLSVAKLLVFALVIVLGFFFGHGQGAHFVPFFDGHQSPSGLATALIPIYFAYSGWNAATYVAGEMRNPHRDLGRALAFGTLACVVLYLAVNAGFLSALGLPGLKVAKDVAGATAAAAFGPGMGSFVTALVALAVLSSLQATIVTGPRIYHAMAEDGLFVPRLAKLHPTTRVPLSALVVQGVLSCLLLLSGRFEMLLNFTTFALCLFSTICVASVIVLRIKRPDLPRAFKTPGYPITPLVFIAGNVWVLYSLVASGAHEALIGGLIVLSGVPAFFYFKRAKARAQAAEARPTTS
jgi:APA family basic amino acid/polyamine antiporter